MRCLMGLLQFDEGKESAYQKKWENNTSDKNPFTNVKGDTDWTNVLRTFVVNCGSPSISGKHCNGGVNVGDVDEEWFEDQDVDP